MANRNSFGGSKWFTVREVGIRKTNEMGVFKATTPNQFRAKLDKIIHEQFPVVEIPEKFDPLSPTLILVTDTQGVVVSETKLF